MIFRNIVAILFAVEIVFQALSIDDDRSPLTAKAWAFNTIIYGLIIYGLYNWI